MATPSSKRPPPHTMTLHCILLHTEAQPHTQAQAQSRTYTQTRTQTLTYTQIKTQTTLPTHVLYGAQIQSLSPGENRCRCMSSGTFSTLSPPRTSKKRGRCTRAR